MKVGDEDEDGDGGKKVTSDCSVNERLEKRVGLVMIMKVKRERKKVGWNFYFMYLKNCKSEIYTK